MISINGNDFESTTRSLPLMTPAGAMSSKPSTSRRDHDHIFNPFTNIGMASRPTPHEHYAPPYWHSAHPAYPRRREVPSRSRTHDCDPYPRTTSSYRHHRRPSYHSTRPHLISPANQHSLKPQPLVCQTSETDIFINTFQSITETARPSSVSSSSSCMAQTPTSTQMDGHSHLPAICTVDEPVLQSPSQVLGDCESDVFSSLQTAVNVPPIHDWLDQGCWSYCKPQLQSHSMQLLGPDGTCVYANDVWDDYDGLGSMLPCHTDDFPLLSLFDSTSLQEEEFQQDQQHLYHQQTMHINTHQHSTHSSTRQSPESTSSRPVSLSPLYDTSQRPPSVAPAESYNMMSPNFPVYQPQPIRPIPIVPLSTLSSIASIDDSAPVAPFRPRSRTTIPIIRRDSPGYHLSKPNPGTHSGIRDAPSPIKANLLSPFSLLCQPVSDSVRYQIEPVDYTHVNEPGTQSMGGDTTNGASPYLHHSTSEQFLRGCGCVACIHSLLIARDIKAW